MAILNRNGALDRFGLINECTSRIFRFDSFFIFSAETNCTANIFLIVLSVGWIAGEGIDGMIFFCIYPE